MESRVMVRINESDHVLLIVCVDGATRFTYPAASVTMEFFPSRRPMLNVLVLWFVIE